MFMKFLRGILMAWGILVIAFTAFGLVMLLLSGAFFQDQENDKQTPECVYDWESGYEYCLGQDYSEDYP
jgi:hypothetical protein